MQKNPRNLSHARILICFLVSFIFIISTISAQIGNQNQYSNVLNTTVVNISPPSQVVYPNQAFIVEVYVTPHVPINAVSFDLFSFNPTLVQAQLVSEGTLFEDAQSSFFNPGDIDNVVGEITNVYGLSVPATFTTIEAGIFCTVEFTALQELGLSDLMLDVVKVSDESGGAVEISVFDGIVTVNLTKNDPPTVIDEYPLNGALDVPLDLSEVSIVVEDIEGDIFDWSIETSPNVGSVYGSNDVNGTKVCSISGLDFETTYTWFVNATDAESDQWSRKVFTFTTRDTSNYPPLKPVISGPSMVKPGKKQVFFAETSDPEGDDLSYWFDWGDGSDSGWTEYISSGFEVNRSHLWEVDGSYDVRVKTRDVYGAESDWSDPLTVNVSKLVLINNIQTGYFYFFNISWAYMYLLDILDISMVIDVELTIDASVLGSVSHVEFQAYNILFDEVTIEYDYNMSDGCMCGFNTSNVSRGLYEIQLTAFDSENNEIDYDSLPLVLFFDFKQGY